MSLPGHLSELCLLGHELSSAPPGRRRSPCFLMGPDAHLAPPEEDTGPGWTCAPPQRLHAGARPADDV